jgi:MOSC domain-containing protein YiiM
MGVVLSINKSLAKGIEKEAINEASVLEGWGIENDAHAGHGDRQVSIFPVEALEKVPIDKYNEVINGGYTENITISGLPLDQFLIDSVVQIGSEVLIEIKHIGKEKFKEHGRPYIVSREGRFGIVLKGGNIRVGDKISLLNN